MRLVKSALAVKAGGERDEIATWETEEEKGTRDMVYGGCLVHCRGFYSSWVCTDPCRCTQGQKVYLYQSIYDVRSFRDQCPVLGC